MNEPKHNHKPNFGRYVADCPRCQVLYPDGPVKRTRKAAEVPATPVSPDMQQLVRLMLEKEARVARKEAEEEQRKQKLRDRDVQLAMKEEQDKKRRWAMCSHTKENGKSARVGQIHSDGLYHSHCCRCFFEFKAEAPRQEQLQMGLA